MEDLCRREFKFVWFPCTICVFLVRENPKWGILTALGQELEDQVQRLQEESVEKYSLQQRIRDLETDLADALSRIRLFQNHFLSACWILHGFFPPESATA